MSGSQRYGADGEGVALEHSRFKARLHALEQQAESRIVFLYFLPSFLNHCGGPYRQEKNPVLSRRNRCGPTLFHEVRLEVLAGLVPSCRLASCDRSLNHLDDSSGSSALR